MKIIHFLSAWWLVCASSAILMNFSTDLALSGPFLLTLCFVLGLYFGALADLKLSKTNQLCQSITEPPDNYKKIACIVGLVFLALIILQLPILFALLTDRLNEVPLDYSRNTLFFGNSFSKFERLIFGVAAALSYNLIMIAGISFLHLYKKPHFLIAAITFALISAFLKGSRAEIYQLFFILVLYFIAVGNPSIKKLNKKSAFIICLMSMVTISTLIFTTIGRSTEISGVLSVAIDYHSIGFLLLSRFIDATDIQKIHSFSYGVSFFGGLDNLTGIVGKFIFGGQTSSFTRESLQFESLPFNTNASAFKDPFYDIQQLPDGYVPKIYTTFFTLLVSGYKSFGTPGPPILGMIFGYLISFLTRRAKQKILDASFYLVMLISCVFMGVFSSALETIGFWMTLIMLNLLFFIFHMMKARS